MYELVQHQRLEGAASSITFSNIPQIYTDLLLVTSLRSSRSANQDSVLYRFNGSSTDYTYRQLYGGAGGGSTVTGSTSGSAGFVGIFPATNNTSSTFGSQQLYISNYRSSVAKSVSSDSVSENNASTNFQLDAVASLWNSTAAITSISLISENSANFVQNSSATLYGVNRTQAIGKPSQPKAIGGNITFANGYWVHTFTGSASLLVNQDITAEYLVIAGGGGSGPAFGGGGAGGYRSSVIGEMSGGGSSAESQMFLSKNQTYAVTVGAGGAKNSSGADSSIGNVTSLGGGYGGTGNGRSGGTGGSGGGGSSSWTDGNSGGSGTSGQGYAGGYASPVYYVDHGAGGGGAGGVGAATSGNNGGNGGVGVQSSITGTAVYRAGGGAGGTQTGTTGSNGLGTGANTGGGGYTAANSGAGDSGLVIIRYKA